jgi:hypothetical protein
MTELIKFGWRRAFLLFAAFGWAATLAASQVRSIRDVSSVEKLTGKTKTVCVGRYLVDVPVQAQISMSHERIAGFGIETFVENEAEFRARISAREAEIAKRGTDESGSNDSGMIEAYDLGIPGLAGRAFVFGRSRGYVMEGDRRVDMESVSVKVHTHMRDLSFSLTDESTREDSVMKAEALLARLQPFGDTEIPTAPGFCVARAFFAEPLPPHKSEHIAMHIGFLDHPDVMLSFASMPGGGSRHSLLTRFADMDRDASVDELVRVTKLRIGPRTINGISGEEVLERTREFNLASTYGFIWETAGVPDDLLHPFLTLELHGGVSPNSGGTPVDTTLHQDAVLTLWDRISTSIRLRTDTLSNSGRGIAPLSSADRNRL